MPDDRTPVTFGPMRQAIARRMTLSKQTAPHVYLSTEIEVDALLSAVARHNEGRDRETRASITAFLVRVLALTLVEHPAFNATWIGPPQVGILAIGKAVPRPVVRDGEIVIRRILSGTLSADHRAVDGAAAARFLQTLKDLVEAPGRWLS